MIIELPWFNPVLSPNRRTHWVVKAKAVEKQRAVARLMSFNKTLPQAKSYGVKITFYPPTNHQRDRDNCLAAIKSYLDGIADGLGVNDKHFHPITIDFGEKVKNGNIIVEII